MAYVTSAEVLALAGITSTEVGTTTVDAIIQVAEAYVDKFTKTTYWSLQTSVTATSATDTTVVKTSAGWTADAYNNMYVWVYSGTGAGQVRKITDTTTDTLTVDEEWSTNPDDTSVIRICYVGRDPRRTEVRDGNNTDTMYLMHYPLVALESATVATTTVTPSYIYQYAHRGKLILGPSAEETYFKETYPQYHTFVYAYGVYQIPEEVKAYTQICAALSTLQTQMGGTHNIPSTYSLPEGSVTIGQAYINIKGTWDTLMKQKDYYEKTITRYVSFA